MIGANIQTDGFDSTRLTDDVQFVDNGVNLASMGLDAPDATPPTGP